MQNKVIQTSNTKPKKEKVTSKKGIVLINSLLTNNIELSKHKSHEIYGQYSPSNLPKNNNSNINSSSNNNNPMKNNTLVSTFKKNINYSGAKQTPVQNILINNTKSKSKKEYGNININDINTQIININSNNKNNNLSENKNEVLKSKRHNLDNILSESDSCQEIDSMEEENLSRGLKSQNKNLKGIHNIKSDSLNYKRHLTTGINNPNNKNNEMLLIKDINIKQSPITNKNKNKITNKKKNKKIKN